MNADLHRIAVSGMVFDRAACHLQSNMFARIDPRYRKKLAELLAKLQLDDELTGQLASAEDGLAIELGL